MTFDELASKLQQRYFGHKFTCDMKHCGEYSCDYCLVKQFENEVRADERAKTIAEVDERYNGDLGSFGFWLYEKLKEQKRRIK